LVCAFTLLAVLLVAAQVLATDSENHDLLSLREQQIVRAIALAAAFAVLLALPLLLTPASRVRIAGRLPGDAARVALTIGVLCALIVDLATVAPGYNTFVEPGEVIPPSAAADWLRSQPPPARIMGLGVNASPPTFVPNSDLLYGLQSVAGYDSLHTARYEDFWAAVDPSVRPAGTSTPYSNVFVRPQV
jgi:hypothetical protein